MTDALTLRLLTNNGFDSVLLTRGERVVSQWTVGADTPNALIQALTENDDLDNWAEQDTEGLTDDAGAPLSVSDYGDELASVTNPGGWTYLDAAQLADRLEFWSRNSGAGFERDLLLDYSERIRSAKGR